MIDTFALQVSYGKGGLNFKDRKRNLKEEQFQLVFGAIKEKFEEVKDFERE